MSRCAPILSTLVLAALLSFMVLGFATSAEATGGDLLTTEVLRADFSGDATGAPPNLALPGSPEGDFLTLNQTGGSVTVLASCAGFSRPIEMKQNFCSGGVAVNAWLAPRPAGYQAMNLRWRSAARDYFGPLMRCEVRGADGALIASVDYRPLGFLKYNLKSLLPIRYRPGKVQEFSLDVDLVGRTCSLSIDGSPVAGYQGVPFAQPATDVARLTFEGDDGHAQALFIDDISAVAFGPPRDRASVVEAPETASGSEGVLLSFGVSAADPDGDPIASLTASPLPSGAAFTVDTSNASGSFDWTPDFTQAGAFAVTFTATNSLVTAVTTAITIADNDRPPAVVAPKAVDGEEGGTLTFAVTASDPDGEAISGISADLLALPPTSDASFSTGADPASGAFVWHMKQGEAGAYVVTFQAQNGGVGFAQTTINVAISGVSVTGSLVWTPRPGEEGSHFVVFTATNDLGEAGTATTEIVCTAAQPVAPAPAGLRSSPTPQGALAPGAVQKGPVVSAPGRASATTGKTIVVTATATASPDGLNPSAAKPGSTPRRAGSLAGSTGELTLVADLTEVDRAQFHVDKDPEITVAATVEAQAGVAVSVPVAASDPDGDPILSLTADWSGLPASNNADFTANDEHTSGLFTWTPGASDSGNYAVSFTAANNLVRTVSTTIHVRGAALARVYSEDSKRIKLSSRGAITLYVEPIASSFDLTGVDLASIRMTSPGTGSVSEISALVGKSAVIGDKDCNRIQDLQVCFNISDLKLLFGNLRGYVTAHATVGGRLTSGGFWSGGIDLRLDAGSGPQHASVSPNPFNPRATLSFTTARPGPASVRLFDIKGRLVRELLVSSSLEIGDHLVTIDGRDADGRMLSSGIYYFRIEADGRTETGRCTIMK